MSGNTKPERRRILNETDDGPIVSDGGPDRRGVLKGVVAAIGTALGLPLLGSTGARANEELAEEFSHPDYVRQSVDDNAGVIDALGEIGVFDEGYDGGGLQTSAIEVDGEYVPEHRLFAESRYGMVTTVVSPDGVSFGGYARIVTTEEQMAEAPWEWPEELGTRFEDGDVAFTIDENGWRENDFEQIGPIELFTELCGTPTECMGPSGDNCWFKNCCGMYERVDVCSGGGGESSSTYDEPCKPCHANPNEECTEDSPYQDPCDHYTMCRWEEDFSGDRECSCISTYPDYYC